MTCRDCEPLRERVRELELMIDPDRSIWEVEITRRVRLTANEAWLLRVLYQANGRLISTGWISDNRPNKTQEEPVNVRNAVAVLMWRVRKVIGRDSIANVRGQGFSLTPEGRRRVEEILQDRP